MLSYLVADDQKDRDKLLLYAISAHDNNLSRGIGLAPNEVHIGKYPRLPMTTLERRGVGGHQGLKANQLEYLQLMKDRQVKAYDLVRQEEYQIKSKHEVGNFELEETLNRRPI